MNWEFNNCKALWSIGIYLMFLIFQSNTQLLINVQNQVIIRFPWNLWTTLTPNRRTFEPNLNFALDLILNVVHIHFPRIHPSFHSWFFLACPVWVDLVWFRIWNPYPNGIGFSGFSDGRINFFIFIWVYWWISLQWPIPILIPPWPLSLIWNMNLYLHRTDRNFSAILFVGIFKSLNFIFLILIFLYNLILVDIRELFTCFEGHFYVDDTRRVYIASKKEDLNLVKIKSWSKSKKIRMHDCCLRGKNICIPNARNLYGVFGISYTF